LLALAATPSAAEIPLRTAEASTGSAGCLAVRGSRVLEQERADERHVPASEDDSNWGNAWRGWLCAVNPPPDRRLPWPTDLDPHAAAELYSGVFGERFGDARRTYDLCLLGMGDDLHTASLFPRCPLLGADDPRSFAAVQWPGKGWRLTLTEAGLRRCGEVVVLVTGAKKADVLREALYGAFDPQNRPVQVLAGLKDRVTWLIDPAAAEKLA